MRSFRLVSRALVVASITFAAVAWGDGEVSKNARLLAESDDFRVRTQAALALGASSDAAAVQPLCGGLGDDNRTVRIASATALTRLGLGGAQCLAERLEVETDSRVQASIKKALASLGLPEPAIGAATKYYIAVAPLKGPDRLERPFRRAMVKGIGSRGDVAIAPASETADQAAAVLRKYESATGFMLSSQAVKPQYEGGTLRIKISVAILTYPGSAILGTFSQKVAVGGVTEPDPALEQELVEAAAEAAMQKFLTIAPGLAQ